MTPGPFVSCRSASDRNKIMVEIEGSETLVTPHASIERLLETGLTAVHPVWRPYFPGEAKASWLNDQVQSGLIRRVHCELTGTSEYIARPPVESQLDKPTVTEGPFVDIEDSSGPSVMVWKQYGKGARSLVRPHWSVRRLLSDWHFGHKGIQITDAEWLNRNVLMGYVVQRDGEWVAPKYRHSLPKWEKPYKRGIIIEIPVTLHANGEVDVVSSEYDYGRKVFRIKVRHIEDKAITVLPRSDGRPLLPIVPEGKPYPVVKADSLITYVNERKLLPVPPPSTERIRG